VTEHNSDLKSDAFRTIFYDVTLDKNEIDFFNTLERTSPLRGDVGAMSAIAINYKTAKINEAAGHTLKEAVIQIAEAANLSVKQAEKTSQDTKRLSCIIVILTGVLAAAAVAQTIMSLIGFAGR
jgi:hypothetical protein